METNDELNPNTEKKKINIYKTKKCKKKENIGK